MGGMFTCDTKNEQLQKSGENSFQLKIYNKATCSAPLFTSWHETPTNIVKTPIFSLRIVFLVGILFVDVSKFSKKNAVVCNVWKKKLFCEWNPENMYYSFVDQVIKCPICKAILEDGHILRAFAGLFPGKISGTYLEKVAPITTQLNMSQIGSNPANIEHEKSLKSPIHTIQELLKNCQMDEGYCEYIDIYIYTCLCIKIVYVLSILHLISIEY